jgi:hypothetical protein
VASAADTGTSTATGTVKPILDCYKDNGDGSWTAVIGYVNSSGGTRKIPYGSLNMGYPAKFQGLQPTTFKNGTQHGVFVARITASDLWSNARWELDGSVLNYQASFTSSATCPSSTQMPADGNGAGPVIALAVAGAAGAVVVHRVRRRTAAEAGPTQDSDDA